MIKQQAGALTYYQFETLKASRVIHGVFTRQGGVSKPPFASLNVGGSVGDQQAAVEENKRRILDTLSINKSQLFEVWQVHSDRVVRTSSPHIKDQPIQKADAIITDAETVALVMRFADCVPIFLYDPIHHAIGLVHAGWKGTILNIVGKTVKAMEETFSTPSDRLFAYVGPSIGPDHYTIGPDVTAEVEKVFSAEKGEVLKTVGNEVKFDLWKAMEISLAKAGVRNIEISQICTACQTEEWYSHRAEGGETGRFAAVFALQ